MSLLSTKALYKSGNLPKSQYIDSMYERHISLFEYARLLRDTDIGRIEITDDCVVMVARGTGVKIVCPLADKRVAPLEVLNFDYYEKTDSDMMLRLIRPGFGVFDVGANIGWYSLYIARSRAGCQIYAFEPMPQTFAQLKQNIQVNQAENVQAFNFGISDREGEILFHYDATSSGSACSAVGAATDNTLEIRSPVRTLDGFVQERGAKVDFLKCDVEGAELSVLRGGLETLKEQRPILFLEMLRKWARRFGYHPNEIVDLLAGLGYRCFIARGADLSAFGRMDEETTETNFFFLHATRHGTEIAALEKR